VTAGRIGPESSQNKWKTTARICMSLLMQLFSVRGVVNQAHLAKDNHFCRLFMVTIFQTKYPTFTATMLAIHRALWVPKGGGVFFVVFSSSWYIH
jgi:hypothetical protein